ncbi:uncharacterized protein LOC124350825 isoform X2 [Daphnia pulicaria]|uniref:uncharacterized protein LOC124350825 isoform X2 n=1 Tax=Daphnia pulicaria TaxID=35523 RepID=UPI001EE9E6C6|nr:uncharacterized protein LOC124350825 isoform X2 [Daphnia pulicaria]
MSNRWRVDCVSYGMAVCCQKLSYYPFFENYQQIHRRKRERVVAVVQPTVNYFVQNHFILLDVSSKGYSLDWNNSSGLWGILTYTRVNLQTGWPVCPYERLKVTRNIT